MTTPNPRHQATAPITYLHMETVHQSKLYTDNTGRCPIRAGSRNQYVMVAYHSSTVILVQPFKSRKDT